MRRTSQVCSGYLQRYLAHCTDLHTLVMLSLRTLSHALFACREWHCPNDARPRQAGGPLQARGAKCRHERHSCNYCGRQPS